MNRFSRTVLGYHGCDRKLAHGLISGRIRIADWKISQNDYDWLGAGIYFWEHSPERAWQWAHDARERYRRQGKGFTPAVVGAVIQLGACLDLTDADWAGALTEAYDITKRVYRAKGWALPSNTGPKPDLGCRKRDCLVVNECVRLLDAYALSPENTAGLQPIQTVRAPFFEGEPLYPGAMFRSLSHIQIAVRNPACILGVFLPNS
jgi:hypothetical protein